MSRCGDCDNYRASSAMGPSSGLCSAQKTGENTYKMITYHMDASKCKFYKKLDTSEVRTDTINAPIDPKNWKPYKDFEEKKADVSIDKDKVKDTKQWG